MPFTYFQMEPPLRQRRDLTTNPTAAAVQYSNLLLCLARTIILGVGSRRD
jgi:hypothetical protein